MIKSIKILPHPPEVLDVDSKIIEDMKDKLKEKPMETPEKDSLVDRP